MTKNKTSMKSLIAYEKIVEMILSGNKLPGARLVLTELESELGIGRGPIRDALLRLDRSGLVKNIPFKGAEVASPPKPKEIAYIFDIRVELELRLAEEALPMITINQISELERLLDEMKRCPSNFYNLDRQFHDIIYEGSGLLHLCLTVQKLIQSVDVFLILFRREKSDYTKSINEHLEIIEAINAKDSNWLKTILRQNIMTGLQIIEKYYPRIVRVK